MTRNSLLLRLATLGTLSLAILGACSDHPREITAPVVGPRTVIAPGDTATPTDPDDPTYSSGSSCTFNISPLSDARMTVSQTLRVNVTASSECGTITWTADSSAAVKLTSTPSEVAVYAKKAVNIVRIKGTVGSTSKDFALQILPATIEIVPATATILVNGTKQLPFQAYDHQHLPLSENYAEGRSWSFGSSNTGVATINPYYLVTGKSPGTALIIASMAGGVDTSTITVVSDPVATVTVSPSTVTIGTGETTQLTATLKSSNGTVLTGRAITWSSSRTSVATVSSTGVVTGVAGGTATITATAEGKSGAASITVLSCMDCKTPWVPTGPGL